MRYFLILLLSVITFCAESQVTIPDKVARFYLQQSDKVVLLEQQIVIKNEINTNLLKQLTVKDNIIATYKQDSASYEGIITTKDSIISDKDEELKTSRKSLRRVTTQRNVTAGISIGALIGLPLGQPLIGGAIGGGAAFVGSLFKKRAR